MRIWRIGISVCALLFLLACGGGRERSKMVSVTIEPQRYFAERIAGDRFEVNRVVPPGQSPETYDPTPRQMARIGESAAYLRIGPIGFELAWMDKIRENNPDMPVFDLSEGIPALKEPEGSSERHEVTRHHYHAGGADPHVWSGIMGF